MTRTPSAVLADLEAAQKDLALAQRLKTADKRIEQLTAEYEAARAESDRAEAEAQAAALEARFAGISDIRIETRSPQHFNSVLQNTYMVTWTAPKWDHRTNGTTPSQHTIAGFRAVPGNVLAYLIERQPELSRWRTPRS
ncbi:hypothetical protein A6F68_02659 [Tsuneonella dongtanensis]|uniref:Chromosome partition protein Smc n=1 Tax=Tsuneonella dongtanensis TaxID=692370 RepID=A0A1B2AG74_9SPHN|nr:hypothetical protein [Tsuneonella dongtanensis]ANY21153.1 hypothetical protein A6F68_02659 [Tsuneonella dongtanensis]